MCPLSTVHRYLLINNRDKYTHTLCVSCFFTFIWCARTHTIIGMCLLITFFLSSLSLMWGLWSSPVSEWVYVISLFDSFGLHAAKEVFSRRSSCFCINTVFSIHSLRFYLYFFFEILLCSVNCTVYTNRRKNYICLEFISIVLYSVSFFVVEMMKLFWKKWMNASVNKPNGHRLRWKETEFMNFLDSIFGAFQSIYYMNFTINFRTRRKKIPKQKRK